MSKNQLLQLVFRFGHKVFVGWWWLTRPVTQGVKCVILYEGKVLLVKLSYGYRCWSFPGGGVKRKETTKEAVVREVLEETGITIKLLDLQFVTKYDQQIEYKSDTVTCYLVKVTAADYIIDNREICEAAWFDLDSLPPKRTPSVDNLLLLIKGKDLSRLEDLVAEV